MHGQSIRFRVILRLDVQAKTNSTVPPLPEEEAEEGEGGGVGRRFLSRVSSRISGWKAVDYAQYTALAVTQVGL